MFFISHVDAFFYTSYMYLQNTYCSRGIFDTLWRLPGMRLDTFSTLLLCYFRVLMEKTENSSTSKNVWCCSTAIGRRRRHETAEHKSNGLADDHVPYSRRFLHRENAVAVPFTCCQVLDCLRPIWVATQDKCDACKARLTTIILLYDPVV